MLVDKLAFLLSLKQGGAWNMWFLVEKMRLNGSVHLTSILPDILRRAGLPVLAVTMATMMFGGQQALADHCVPSVQEHTEGGHLVRHRLEGHPLEALRAHALLLQVVVFISLSKSVSRGMTTGGCFVANRSAGATKFVRDVGVTAQMFDTLSKPDQVSILINNHTHVEERCQKAYENAASVGQALGR